LLGEIGVRENCDRHLILRTAWVYGAKGHGNFVKTMLRLGADRPVIKVVSDQVGTPTWANDIAETTARLITLPVAETAGTYHFTSSGAISWYDFAIAIFSEALELGLLTNAPDIVPITTAEYPTVAQRPANSALYCTKLRDLLGQAPPYWRDSLRQMLRELVS
ncbi:MAG: sugar nucleotide-binding protein, partial [Cyanobacteria bacterium J06628_4]